MNLNESIFLGIFLFTSKAAYNAVSSQLEFNYNTHLCDIFLLTCEKNKAHDLDKKIEFLTRYNSNVLNENFTPFVLSKNFNSNLSKIDAVDLNRILKSEFYWFLENNYISQNIDLNNTLYF